jgi:hypothetical protein
MSDNFWCKAKSASGKDYFVSMDGVKQEASAVYNDAILLGKWALSQFNSFDVTWEKFALDYLPRLLIDPIAVLGSIQIKTLGHGSGHPGTAYLNHIKTCIWMNEFMDKVKKKDTYPLLNMEGEFPEVELVNSLAGVIMEITNMISFPDLDSENDYWDIDMLGFAIVNGRVLGAPGVWLPVLQKVKMYKALLFFKNDPTEKKDLTYRQKLMIEFWRYRALYLIGGWFYTPVNTVIASICKKKKELLEDSEVVVSQDIFYESITNAFKKVDVPPSTIQPLLKLSASQEVPTLEEVRYFLTGNEKFLIKSENPEDLGLRKPVIMEKAKLDFPYDYKFERADKTKTFTDKQNKPHPEVQLPSSTQAPPAPYTAKERWQSLSKEQQESHENVIVDFLKNVKTVGAPTDKKILALASVLKVSAYRLSQLLYQMKKINVNKNVDFDEIIGQAKAYIKH